MDVRGDRQILNMDQESLGECTHIFASDVGINYESRRSTNIACQ